MKKIYHAEFCFKYSYQYFTPQGKGGIKYGSFSGCVPRVYLEGEEDKVWKEIESNFGSTKTKRYTLTNKEINNKINVGKQAR